MPRSKDLARQRYYELELRKVNSAIQANLKDKETLERQLTFLLKVQAELMRKVQTT